MELLEAVHAAVHVLLLLWRRRPGPAQSVPWTDWGHAGAREHAGGGVFQHQASHIHIHVHMDVDMAGGIGGNGTRAQAGAGAGAELVEQRLRRVAVLVEESGLAAAVEELALGLGHGGSSSRMGQATGTVGAGGAPADELLRAVAAAAGGAPGSAGPTAVSARYQAVSAELPFNAHEAWLTAH